MSLPSAVGRRLRALLIDSRGPACLEIDADHRLLARWGYTAARGLEGLRVGDGLLERLPFLADYPSRERTALRFLHGPNDTVSHVHLLPREEGGRYAVWLDAAEEHRERREAQQLANDIRLLYHRQGRLVDELVEARGELDTRRREAEEESRAKSRFIATMSHEFRTPLSAVVTAAGLLQEEAALGRDGTARLAALRRGAERLVALVDDLLDQARLEAGQMAIRPHPVDCRRLLEDLAAMFAPLAAEKALAFAAEVDPAMPRFVSVDETRLRQILVNLLGNAVKFTREGSVRVALAWRDGQLSAVAEDTGPGIAAADRERAFDAYAQLEHAEGKPGAGLGLSIVLRLVELMGGAIELDSEPGHGARFELVLPAAEAVAVAPAGDAGPARVLIAEDDPDMLDLVRLGLSRAGWSVTVATDGRQALEKALAESPAVVVMDLGLPGLDGIAVARRLREEGFAAPILGLSGSREEREIETALAAGFSQYLAKPVQLPALVAQIERLLADTASR